MNKQSTVLVTGGAGYIGSHVVKRFLASGWRVIVFDNFSHGYRQVIDILQPLGDLVLYEGDLLDKSALAAMFKKESIDQVVHLAAPCEVNESMARPDYYFADNVQGTLNLLVAMHEQGVKRIIFSSTCAVYGQIKALPVSENDEPSPESVYGEAKLMAEKEIQWYGRLFGINYVIFRFFNACGAASDGMIGDSKRPSALLMQNAVRGALGIEDFYLTYAEVATPDGSPIRDYVDVEDLAEIIYVATDYLGKGEASGTFHIGNGAGYSVKEVVAAIENRLQLKLLAVKAEQLRQGEVAAVYADISRLQTTLVCRPKKTLAQSIDSLVKWYKNKPNGYDY